MIKAMLQLTQEQISYLNGLMLGDGCLSKFVLKSKNCRLRIQRKLTDLDFLEKQYNIFKDFYKNRIKLSSYFDSRTNKKYENCYSQTRFTEEFGKFREKWYPNGKKIVPRDLKLNDIILYQWFCDDGCIIAKSKKNLRTKFATHGFVKEDVKFLQKLLNDYLNSNFKINKEKQKNGKNVYFLQCSTKSSKLLIKKINKYFEDGIMLRKCTWRNV